MLLFQSAPPPSSFFHFIIFLQVDRSAKDRSLHGLSETGISFQNIRMILILKKKMPHETYCVRDHPHFFCSSVPFTMPPSSDDIPMACGVFVEDDRVFLLQHLFVPTDRRRQGIGTHLIGTVARECIARGCRRIDVDDMSQRQRNDRNVYRNTSFVYSSSSGPEMYSNPKRVLRACDFFLSRYR